MEPTIRSLFATACAVALALPAGAAGTDDKQPSSDAVRDRGSELNLYGAERSELAGPMEDVQEAAEVVRQMRADPELAALIERSKGLLIVPDYVVAGLIAGGAGGEGVLVTQEDGEWSNPVFYDIGSVSVGAQAGIAAGSIAYVLMSDQAVNSFLGDTSFALTAEAGFSLVNWSGRAHGEIGQGDDIVAWTDTEGLFGELSVGVSGISWDDEENEAYYGRQATAADILDGKVRNPHATPLGDALAAR